MLLRICGLSRPVQFVNCDELYRCLPLVLINWKTVEVPDSAQPPILTLRQCAGTYSVEAPWLAKPLQSKERVAALCGFVAELVRAVINDNLGMLCLHGAAAEFGGRLVVFPNRYRAGKSLLSVCLMAAGVRLFCDDVLPVGGENDRGIALGIAPRLRLPLPDDLAAETREFISGRRALASDRYLYLRSRHGELARRGSSAPIGAFVLLDRKPGVRATLDAATSIAVLRQVILQNFAREPAAPEILERLYRIVENAQCYRLCYGRADDAAALLRDTFAAWPCNATEGKRATAKHFVPQPMSENEGNEDSGQIRRTPGITERGAEGERFLADRNGAAIHHLNPLGSAIWEMLAEPIADDEVIELVADAFPDVGAARIDDDVRAFLGDLRTKGLVVDARSARL